MFNNINLLGNLTRDIELRYSQSGSAIANVGMATSHKFTVNGEKKEEVMFIDLTFFGKSAEIANQYLRKGSKIFVVGRLKLDQWVGQDGAKHSKHSVVVETMKMLDSKTDGQPQQNYNQTTQQQQYKPQQQAPQSYQKQQQDHTAYREQPRPMPDPRSLPNIDIDEENIPF